MQKKRNKKVRILVIIFILVISISVLIFFRDRTNKDNIVIAKIHISKEYEEERDIKYRIKFKDYRIDTIEKEIVFKNNKAAQLGYTEYEIINEYEKEKFEVEIRGKKIIVTMTEEQFKEEIGYNDEKDLIIPLQNGKLEEIIDQEYLKELLLQQGYEIK